MLFYEQESEILYELVKYSYHQIDNPFIKKTIFDTMNEFGETSYLLDTIHDFNGTPYSTLLHKGYEYERFFSLSSLAFVYGDNLPLRIKDKTYFPHYFCDDTILLDSNDKTYEYFKVIFHKKLREFYETRGVKVHCDDSFCCHSLYDLLIFIYHNSNCRYVSNNIIWVMTIFRKSHLIHNDVLYQPYDTKPLCSKIMLVVVNTAFLLFSMITTV
jgi:hypothetical protein